MSDYTALKNEITTDPSARGYAGKTNAQVAALLMAPYRQTEKTAIAPMELFEAINDPEWVALQATAQARINSLFTIGGTIPITLGTRVRTMLLSFFAAGSVTRTNLANLLRIDHRRCDDIGWTMGVHENDVAAAKAL